MALGRVMETGPLGAFKKRWSEEIKKIWRDNWYYTVIGSLGNSCWIFCCGGLDFKI